MDSSKRETQNQLEAIRQSILDDRLTHAQICDALAEAIKRELQKGAEEVDIEYVAACQRLMESLNQEKAARIESHADQNYAAIQAKLRKEKHPIRGRSVIQYVFAAICLLVLLLGADILLTRRQINIGYSPDNERIIYDGTVIRPGIVEIAGADDIDREEVQELTTADWNEGVDFLGFAPEIPTWIPDEWKLDDYYCVILESFSWFVATYSHEGSDEVLQYSMEYYFGSEPLYGSYEQDGVGYELTTIGGKRIYVTSNMGSNVVFWHDNESISAITGPITTQEMIKMIESMDEQE